jgi:signal transduction histidine kinase
VDGNEEGSGHLDEGRLLLDLTREVTSSLDLQDVLDRSLRSLRRLIDFNGGSIQLITDGYLQMVAGDPQPPPEAFEFRLPIGEGFGGRVAATGEVIYSADATTDPRAHPEGRRRASVAGTHSWFGAPLIVHGDTIGIVQLDDLEVDHFPPPVQARILSFLPIVSAAVQNALLFGREREAVARLQEVEGLKRDFAAAVSHELRTPLTVVQGFAGMLASGTITSANVELREIGERIVQAARRLEGMITDVLLIAGIESAPRAVRLLPIDVASMLEQALQSADRGTHELVLAIDPDLPAAHSDLTRLADVLAKLLDNAQKFSAPGSVVTVGATAEDGAVVVTVEDHGCGIPDDMLELIFEPFVQVDSTMARPAGGLGTGLFLVRSIGTAVGASVTVESTEGVGSTFAVRLPTGDDVAG